ncbi:MAG: glycosylasparaginase [Bacteroidetes bacterium 4572_77]|nr:MAG: glycosylasparaginase [Bacteroidetes bacterium 4572_77]
MTNRRRFLKKIGLLGGAIALPILSKSAITHDIKLPKVNTNKSIVLSTWEHGLAANQKAMEVMLQGKSTLDAVEQGVMVPEADPLIRSVGYGGRPDRDGYVTLDAAIMDNKGNAGSVCFVQNYMHPISIARKVMEETKHVILSGEGAEQFAHEQGFEKKDLLTEKSKKSWEKWKIKSQYKTEVNIENHDTIGMVGLHNGEIATSCTTSGLAYKMHGRVGDSPIIGAGLFADGEIGACAATGVGEYVLKTQTTFLVVELMRQGKSPEEACISALQRIKSKYLDKNSSKQFQIGLVALNVNGEYAGYSLLSGYQYAIMVNGENKLIDAPYLVKRAPKHK